MDHGPTGPGPTGPGPTDDEARCRGLGLVGWAGISIERGGRPRGRPAADHHDRGTVTVEAALALCTLAVFLALAVGVIAAAAGSVRCVDAARELARLAARGEPERGRTVAGRLAPTGAALALRTEGDLVVAEVSVELLHPLPARIGGRAVAALEPGAAPP
jgi:hypothetical protein